MPSVKLVVTISVIIGVIVVVGVGFSISSRPAGINEKPNTNQVLNQQSISRTHNTQVYTNSIIRQVFLNNSTHIRTPYVKEYSMPNGTWPNGILVARNGIVWTVGTMSHTLIGFDPKQGKIVSSHPIITPQEEANKTNPKSKQGFQMVWSIVESTDGSIWFPEGGSDPLWRFDPNTQKFQVIHSISAAPMQMKVDKKSGNIWFTTFGSGTFGVIQKIIENKVGITSPEYKVTEFNLGNDSFPSGIFLQGDSVWITETLNHNKLVEFKPIVDTNGKVFNVSKVLEIPSSSRSSSSKQQQLFTTPTDLVVFANSTRPSSIWLAEHGTDFITEYLLDSHNIIRFPTSSSPRHYITLPYWIAEPADHKGFWFNEHEGNRIAFFNTTAMTLLEYEVPTRDPFNGYIANALTLSADPNDNNKVWFTEFNHDKIGVLDSSPPIPFDINSSARKITMLSSPNNTTQKNASPAAATLNVEVTTKKSFNRSSFIDNSNTNANNNRTLIFLNASSSMNPLGKFVNMIAKFYPTSIVELNKDKSEKAQSNMIFQRNGSTPISPGNYTLGISATNGIITKSIFRYLFVK
jgi:sugar lactone lactonase YvrE